MNDFNELTLDLLNQGATLMATENYEEATKCFEKAVQESPKYIDCYINLGNAYASLEEFDKATQAFKKALILDSKNVEVLFGLGNLSYLQGSLEDALKYYNQAEDTGEMNEEMYDVLSDIFQSNEDYVQAIRYINKAIKLNPLNGEYYLTKTRIFVDQQKADEAIETLRELNAVLPDAFEAYDMLAEIYTIKEDYNNAISTVEKAVYRFPNDPSIAYLKLRVLVKFQKDNEALKYVDEMKKNGLYEPQKEENALLEADIYVRAKKLEEAVNCLETALENKYDNSQAAFVLINIYLTLANFEKIIEITEYMMDKDNDLFYDSTAYFYHAEALNKLDKKDEAKEEFKVLVKKLRNYTIVDPSFYQGYIYRVLSHKELGEYDEALRLTDYIENLFLERPDGYIMEYTIYEEQGNEEKAGELLAKIKEIDPAFSIE